MRLEGFSEFTSWELLPRLSVYRGDQYRRNKKVGSQTGTREHSLGWVSLIKVHYVRLLQHLSSSKASLVGDGDKADYGATSDLQPPTTHNDWENMKNDH